MTAHRWRRPGEPPPGHTHRLPPWLILSIIIIGLGLTAGLVLVAEQAIATNNRLTAVEQYVAGKGDQRDRENAALNRRIDQAVCNVLDQLPAGGNLDRVRAEYGCGPGLTRPVGTDAPSAVAPPAVTGPTSAASPSTAGALARPTGAATTGPTAPPRTSATLPGSALAATSSAAGTTATAPTPRPSAAPTTTPTPRGPIAGLLCGVLPVCTPPT